MRNALFTTLLLFVAGSLVAQQGPRVVLHLQSADTLVHKSVVNQIGTIKRELPDAQVELVCHGPGVSFLLKDSPYARKLPAKQLRDVAYVACEFTMAQKNIKKEDLVSFATTVPSGLVEILKKQQEGWLYAKLGF